MKTAIASTLPLLLAAGAVAQAVGSPVLASMEALARAVADLDRAIEAGDRDTFPATLDAIARANAGVGEHTGRFAKDTDASQWIAAIDEAIADLRRPGGTLATDRFDFARLRAACTACHVRTRDGNPGRGLFPNRGNVLFGTLELLAKDGTAREDRGGTVVFLEGSLAKSPPLPRKPIISQKGRQFDPEILVVTAGTTVRFPNNDVVFHNVFSKSVSNPFELGTYGKGVEKEVRLDNTGLVRVHCNIHPDMASNVIVLENGFAAITETDGSWTIPDVPDGEYRLRVWHPLADPLERPVGCSGGVAESVALTVRETKARVQHTNKHGRKYRVKY